MTRQLTIDLDSANYEPARTALEWAFHNAKRLGYSLPCGFDVALALLKGEARTGFFISTSNGGFYSIVQTNSDWDNDDFDDFMEFLTARARKRKERRQEAREAARIVGEFALALAVPPAGPTCADCGKPRAKGSAARCRACYEANASYAREIEAAADAS